MIRVQRKYKLVKANSIRELQEIVNELIQKEYKDTEGFIFRSSARWQCIGGPIKDSDYWIQALVFYQDEEI
ncbi:MAG: hypothetical protein CMI23_05020 [Opitutae bacterium]|nr:hypothetical protein [Opitutae bacterium]|tara:strand:- start:6609 stop:6821 length:213 start_codon:yes stop_codon:yes gene_type:complete